MYKRRTHESKKIYRQKTMQIAHRKIRILIRNLIDVTKHYDQNRKHFKRL